MQTKDWLSALAAGFLSAGLFLFIAASGLGFFFLFLPVLPLFWVGLGNAPGMALYGGLIAAGILIFADAAAGVAFLLVFGLPAWTMARLAMLWRERGQEVVWFPIGLILMRLTLYAAAFVAAAALFYANQEGGIAQVISTQVHAAFGHLGEEYAPAIALLAGRWAFLLFPMAIWLWGLMLYAYGWLANALLRRLNRRHRPDFSIQVFFMPHWMLPLLGLCAAASLFGSASLALVGKALVVALMLPYFFSGAALIHKTAADWPGRKFFLFFIYLLIFAQFWPALVLSGIGLAHHIKGLSGAKNPAKH